MTKRRNECRGFTLVELAIVMTIIGLLIGGILKSQEMITNAKVKQFISNMKAYETAVATFRDKYDALPGDLGDADERLPDCLPATCLSGDQDSVIGLNLGALGTFDILTLWIDQTNTANPVFAETVMFWRHLALADLIHGVKADAALATPTWGETHPSSNLGGGFHIAFINGNGSSIPPGHFLVLRKRVSGVESFTAGNMPINPQMAWRIDKAVDDGLADSGDIIVTDLTGAFGLNGCTPYDPTDKQFNCVLASRVIH